MGPEQEIALDEERVPLVPGRVVGREVEGLEVVVVRLDLGALLDGETHAQEDPLDLLFEKRERMGPADVALPAGQGQVRPEGRRGGRGLGHLPEPPVNLADPALELVFEFVDQAPGLAFLLRGDGLQLLEQKSDPAPLAAQKGRPKLLDALGVGRLEGGFVEFPPDGVDPLLQVRHGAVSRPRASASSGPGGRTSPGR